ncbi:hypothetical protein Ancab_012325 [Ancistrocladus abbreviatus]
MKGGKHAEKTTTPTFPRLYVNDVEKGGPRPPSRNKMALYEKRSIPSRRLSSGSASMLPPSPSNLSRLVSSGSSSPGKHYHFPFQLLLNFYEETIITSVNPFSLL